MHLRFFLLNTLFIVGCGGATPQQNSTVPLVEIAQGDKQVAAASDANDDENDQSTVLAKPVEAVDVCRASMREGRGLPRNAMASEAGQLYTEALTHERAQRLNDARKVYLSIIQRYSDSPLVPLVYFAFGELFFQEAQSDPMKVALAEQSYREVTKYPAPENTAMAFSLFRMGEIYAKGGKGTESLSMMQKFMTHAETHPDAQCVKSLASSARTMMVNAYADVGQPNRAFAFFMRSSGTRGSNKIHAFDMVASLCELYIAKQKPQSAAEALVAVNEGHASRDFCTRQQQIMARLSGAIPMIMAEEILRIHVARCE